MEDLSEISELASGQPAFGHLQPTVDPTAFLKTWRINSTIAKATRCLLAQLDPKSFITGAPVDLSDTLAAYDAREFHHIYPKAYLGGQGIPFHEANVIANICMLTASDNNAVSDRAPQDYYPEIPAEILTDVFDRALVPAEDRRGSRVYADFIKARAAALAKKASDLIQNG